MAKYFGDKSLDAEIIIDFKTREFLLDYTLNSVCKHSNYSVIESTFDNLPFTTRSKELIFAVIKALFLTPYIYLMQPLLGYAYKKGLVKNKEYQIEHQKILRDYFVLIRGVKMMTFVSPFSESVLVCHLETNLWLRYNLTGECEKYLKRILLVRHLYKCKQIGKYNSIMQDGWDLIFEFEQPPGTGSVIIESL